MSYHHFSADEYERMIELGILTKDDRTELVRGEIFALRPISPLHAYATMMLLDVLLPRVPDDIRVTVQHPIRVSNDSILQPDIALVQRARYSNAYPTAKDVRLVVEVADTSVAFDREVKLSLYAAIDIPETWLVDLVANRVERHTDPRGDFYRLIHRYWRDDAVESAVIPNLTIPVDDILDEVADMPRAMWEATFRSQS